MFVGCSTLLSFQTVTSFDKNGSKSGDFVQRRFKHDATTGEISQIGLQNSFVMKQNLFIMIQNPFVMKHSSFVMIQNPIAVIQRVFAVDLKLFVMKQGVFALKQEIDESNHCVNGELQREKQ